MGAHRTVARAVPAPSRGASPSQSAPQTAARSTTIAVALWHIACNDERAKSPQDGGFASQRGRESFLIVGTALATFFKYKNDSRPPYSQRFIQAKAVLTMTDHSCTSRIRLNGKESGKHSTTSPDALALGRADRLANVGQLAAGLAHEMNTPLGSISAHAEESLELLEHSKDGRFNRQQADELHGRLMAIMRQANRCSRIATRLLQFAQPGQSLGATCSPDAVTAEVVDLISPAAKEKGIHVEFHIQASLPNAPVGASDLEQLLVNLVQNSVDACEFGDFIRIEVDATASELRFVVADSGCGIPRETLIRIFDPFFTTKPVGQGTGLGLSVCHGIVRSVNGSIELESAPGQGTRVTVLLPLESRPRLAFRVPDSCNTRQITSTGTQETGGTP
jgi:C4-dicarboxylate-specific signal transduction histidine kinase